jgi:adenylate kinase
MVNIVLLGPPGAGKGTQADRLATYLDIPHISSGDLFRAIREEDSPLAARVRSYLDSGSYVSDELTIALVDQRLSQPDTRGGFILDGFPRTVAQADALDRLLAETGRQLDLVLAVELPTELVVQRLAGRIVCPGCKAVFNLVSHPPVREGVCDRCGVALARRSDETPEVVQHRIEVYNAETLPLIARYRGAGTLVEIDGSPSVAVVAAAMAAAVSPLHRPRQPVSAEALT